MRTKPPLYKNSAASILDRVADLIGRLTLDEKVGLMLHDAEAVERLGIPHYVWWNECLHGVGRAGRATVFPQPIGLAASFNAPLLKRVAVAISDEARAKYNEAQKIGNSMIGAGLTFWTPNINIFRDPRWGRGHETYGEDPWLTSRMGVAFIQGLQGNDKRYLKAAACAKHYAIHSGPEPLRHTFDARVSPHDLWDTYLPAFEAAVREARVESVMGAYNCVDGEPCCAHPQLISNVLRKQWQFDGHFVSDCGAIEDFHFNHRVTKTPQESAAKAVKAGCDLCCGAVYNQIMAALKQGLLSEGEIDTCVIRLLKTRMRLGMFDAPQRLPWSHLGEKVVGSRKHRRLALQAARESIVLLKNDGILPLKKNPRRMLVCGPNFESQEILLGNYNGLSERLVTVIEGIVGKVGAGTIVNESRTCPLIGDTPTNSGALKWWADGAEVIIAVMGLSPRIEGEEGDAFNADAGGDRVRIELPEVQQKFLEELKKLGIPIVMVLAAGSAVAIPWAQENANAILQVWYPGEEGGTAVADVLFGDYNPAGRLPITVPVSTQDLPDFTDYAMAGRTYRYASKRPLYPFGYGLSYTSFRYSSATASIKGDRLVVSAKLANTGQCSGDEVVQLYIRPENRPSYAPQHWLAAFERLSLKVGDLRTVRFRLPTQALAMVDESGERRLVAGRYSVHIGGGQPGFTQTVACSVEVRDGKAVIVHG